MRDYRACAATATAARRCQARSARPRRAGFMPFGPKSAGPACPAIPNATWRGGGTACRCWGEFALVVPANAGINSGRHGLELVVQFVLDRRERAERFGRQCDGLAVAV